MTDTPRLRSDLSFIEQVYRGERSYVVKDLTAQRYFRFGASEVRVMRAFDGHRAPREIATHLAEQGLRVSTDAVEQFARKLAAAGFLERTLEERTILQLERLRAERRQRRRHTLFRGELLRMRWSFGDPNEWMGRVLPAIRWMFTPSFIGVSIVLFLVYAIVLAGRFADYTAQLAATYSLGALTLGRVLLFVASGLVVVLIHELGHGFTCKYFGGSVHELGFMLLYFQPAFYCNVSDAWSFPERRARLWVTAAGSWIQLVVAGLAAIVWWLAQPGTLVAEITVAAMLIGGAMTLLTNMNPLLPLDGYFALTDWLEIPNLRQRALAHASWWVHRHVLRLERPEPPASARERRVFLIYGGLASAYIALTLFLFASFLVGWGRRTFGVVGGVSAAIAVALLLRQTLLGWWRTGVLAVRTHRVAWRRRLRKKPVLVGASTMALLCLVIPWPLTSTGPAIVRPAASVVIAAADSGIVSEVLAAESARLAAGAPVVRLTNYSLVGDRWRLGRAVDSLAAAEVAARATGRVADAEALAANRRSELAQLAAVEERVGRLTRRAPIAGTVVTIHPEDLVGRAVQPGDSLVVVATLDTVEVRIALTGAGATSVRAGDVVHLVSYGAPERSWTGRVDEVAVAADSAAQLAGVIEARVRMAPNEVWRSGARGEAIVEIGRSTIAGALWWRLRQWVRGDVLL